MESLYFGMFVYKSQNLIEFSALISLSTIGFGDMVPMVEPPLMYADAVRNESGAFSLNSVH